MKKVIILSFVLLSIISFSYGQSVNAEAAKIVGEHFLNSQSRTNGRVNVNLELTYKAEIKSADNKENSDAYFYVYNSTSKDAFVIISGDESITPILGYSDEGSFDPKRIPSNVAKWLEGYKIEIRDLTAKKVKPSTEITQQWENLKNGSINTTERSKAVAPLIKTKWDQSPYYNAYAPGNSVTGCVATAMAQVMKYWNFPLNGSGFHSYNHSLYGTLAANFGSAAYDWSSMPNIVNSPNPAVALLMYHSGISVDMNYGTEGSGSEGGTIVAQAFQKYFGYSTTVSLKERKNYPDQQQWIALLKQELDASRPIYHEGVGNGSGHAFVCDGYDNNNFFHFNWGWSGLADGYYTINELNPTSLGTGAGLGSYNSNQKIVIGIQPPVNQQILNISLYDYVTPSDHTIGYNNPFSISTNIVNNGTVTFSGDITAAVFDSEETFVGYIETLSNYSLPSNNYYVNDLVFSTDGMLSMLPGTYHIGIFVRPTGGGSKYRIMMSIPI